MKQQEPPNPRQTLAFLIKLFQKHNLGAKSKLGQNFLIDLNLVDLVARSGDLSPEDAVLEVGTGTGSLTGRMALEAGSVTSVEIDPGFARMARELLGANPKVRLVESDALLNKNTMEPTVLAAWREMAAKTGCTRLKMVANLPYSVAVPVLTNLLIEGPVPVRMVGMVQWEIAERMMATPGHKQFGSLAVLIQALSKVTVIRRIPPRGRLWWKLERDHRAPPAGASSARASGEPSMTPSAPQTTALAMSPPVRMPPSAMTWTYTPVSSR